MLIFSKMDRSEMKIRYRRRLGGFVSFALLAVFAASPAAAHFDASISGGFGAGFRHPLSGPDHLLAMVAVGLWGAFLGRPLIYLLPIIFPTVMAFGGAMGMAHVPMPPIEIGIALSVLLLGAAIALALKPPIWAAALLVGIFAIFHGYAHGTELPSIADPIAFSAGFVLATGVLHIFGIGVGLLTEKPGGVRVVRAIGCLIAASGGWFLFQAVA
jgi:urease accessory protein